VVTLGHAIGRGFYPKVGTVGKYSIIFGMTDRELWQRIQAGNEAAFQELFYRHHPAMVNLAFVMLRDESLARDIAQDVFVRLWVKRSEIQIHGACKSYLLSAVRNRCITELKKEKKLDFTDQIETLAPAQDAHDNMHIQDLEKSIQSGIQRLPDACRTVFVLRRLEELSLKEIASQLGISPKTVENQLTKAHKILASHLKPLLLWIWVLLNFIHRP